MYINISRASNFLDFKSCSRFLSSSRQSVKSWVSSAFQSFKRTVNNPLQPLSEFWLEFKQGHADLQENLNSEMAEKRTPISYAILMWLNIFALLQVAMVYSNSMIALQNIMMSGINLSAAYSIVAWVAFYQSIQFILEITLTSFMGRMFNGVRSKMYSPIQSLLKHNKLKWLTNQVGDSNNPGDVFVDQSENASGIIIGGAAAVLSSLFALTQNMYIFCSMLYMNSTVFPLVYVSIMLLVPIITTIVSTLALSHLRGITKKVTVIRQKLRSYINWLMTEESRCILSSQQARRNVSKNLSDQIEEQKNISNHALTAQILEMIFNNVIKITSFALGTSMVLSLGINGILPAVMCYSIFMQYNRLADDIGLMMSQYLYSSRQTTQVGQLSDTRGWLAGASKRSEFLVEKISSDTTNTIVDCKDISICSSSVNTDSHAILSNITLTLNINKRYIVIGGSGIGKSTLFKLLTNLVAMRNNDGILYGEIGRNGYLKVKPGALKLQPQQLFDPSEHVKTLQEYMCFPDTPDSNTPREIKEYLDLFDDLKSHTYVKKCLSQDARSQAVDSFSCNSFSQGQKQRLRNFTLFHKLEIGQFLLLDEICSSLDEENSTKLINHLVSKEISFAEISHLYNSRTIIPPETYDEVIYVSKDGVRQMTVAEHNQNIADRARVPHANR